MGWYGRRFVCTGSPVQIPLVPIPLSKGLTRYCLFSHLLFLSLLVFNDVSIKSGAIKTSYAFTRFKISTSSIVNTTYAWRRSLLKKKEEKIVCVCVCVCVC